MFPPRLFGRLLGTALISICSAAHAATFTVTSNADAGLGTLREVLISANATPEVDTIDFALGPGNQRILLTAALPTITAPIILDGTSNPGWSITRPAVEIACQCGTVLRFDAAGSIIRGLIINGDSTGWNIVGQSGITIVGNWIQLTYSGNPATVYWHIAIRLEGERNVVGGEAPNDRNVIGGGVELRGSDNVVIGNYFGTDPSGSRRLVTTLPTAAVYIAGGSHNRIGGLSEAQRNVFTTDIAVGVAGGDNAIIQNNWIGITALGEPVHSQSGVTPFIYVDRTSPGSRTRIEYNLIAGYGSIGIAASSPVDVRSNTVRNSQLGILLQEECSTCEETASGSVIGGMDADVGNTIASTQAAVTVSARVRGVEITGNRLFGNVTGIVLLPESSNDEPPDADIGGNDLQNYPVLQRATSNGAMALIEGALSSAPDTPYFIQIFSSDMHDLEGKRLVRSFTVTTNSAGIAPFSEIIAGVARGDSLVATATNRGNQSTLGNSPSSTSEFSPAILILEAVPAVSWSFLIALAVVLAIVGLRHSSSGA